MPATLTRQRPAPKRVLLAAPSPTPGRGTFVKQSGPLKVLKRQHGDATFYEFVERPAEGELKMKEHPLVYTYNVNDGTLSLSSEAFWGSQELMTASKNGLELGRRPAVPGDPETALRVARAHYDQYSVPADPALKGVRRQKLLNGTN